MTVFPVDENINLSKQTVVCLGLFDGVHIGHARLIERAREVAVQDDLLVCVHTFDRMPAQVIHPGRMILELTPLEEKAALLGALGVDILAVSHFDDTMMHMHADTFFQSVLLDKLRAAHVVIGFHHRFGFHGEAGAETLQRFCERAGVGLSVITPVMLAGGELVSSTAIRRYLSAGDAAAAEAMLGRPWGSESDHAFGRKST